VPSPPPSSEDPHSSHAAISIVGANIKKAIRNKRRKGLASSVFFISED
jgi:hypothetical protein